MDKTVFIVCHECPCCECTNEELAGIIIDCIYEDRWQADIHAMQVQNCFVIEVPVVGVQQ